MDIFNFKNLDKNILNKAEKIKLLILDIDGVMTNGQLFLDDNFIQTKAFHVRDGFGIRQLIKEGLQIAVITGRESKLVSERIRELGIQYLFQNSPDKLPIYKNLLKNLNLQPENTSFMGDDLIDLPIMTQVGLSACPKDAYPFVLKHSDFISQYKGGKGAVRELCDLILHSKNRLEPICQQFLKDGSELPKSQHAHPSKSSFHSS